MGIGTSALTSRAAWRVALAILLLLAAMPQSARSAFAAGVVGDGTPTSCTERALDAALAGGGLVTFNCGAGPVTIAVTSQKTIGVDTTIEGGGLVVIAGSQATRVFAVGTAK